MSSRYSFERRNRLYPSEHAVAPEPADDDGPCATPRKGGYRWFTVSFFAAVHFGNWYPTKVGWGIELD